jgi:hypothetical protein
MSIRTPLTIFFTLIFVVSFFAASIHALEKPYFVDIIKTSEDFEQLTDEEKDKLRVYLAQKAVEAEGATINIATLSPVLNAHSYTMGDTAHMTLVWDSPMAQEALNRTESVPNCSPP